MSCKGICAYPHGGWATTALLVAAAAGLAATGCGALSCRFVRLSFAPNSDGGCFEDAFRPDVTGGAPDVATDDSASNSTSALSCQVGLGLYQWLQPAAATASASSGGGDWTSGTCVGYQQTMLDRLNDVTFQAARGVGVFAVLLAFVLFLWDLVLSCLQLNRLQVWLLRLCSLLAVVASGLTFLLNRSAVCGNGNVTSLPFDNASCAMDQGALAMLAACLLWFGHLVVAAVWIRTPKTTTASRAEDSTDRDCDDPAATAAIDPTTRQQQQRDDEALKAHVMSIRNSRANEGSHNRNSSGAFNKSLPRNRPAAESESESILGGDPEEVPRKPRSWFGSRHWRSENAATDGDGDDVRRSQPTLTVDDVTSQEQLEVYLSQRLDAIEKHIDED